MTANNETNEMFEIKPSNDSTKKSYKKSTYRAQEDTTDSIELPDMIPESTVIDQPQDTKTEFKEKLSGLVHPSRIKTKKVPKISLKLIKKAKNKSINFF